MSWNGKDESTAGYSERGFTLDVDDRVVPGVYWQPADGPGKHLVLLGHGGGADKKVEYISLIAHGLCKLGIAAMAIDGPGHGDRPGADTFAGAADPSAFKKRWESGGGTTGMIADWRASLDFIEAEDGVRPTGLLGLSMGTMMGLPVAVSDNRVKVAVLGLMGLWGVNAEDIIRLAPELTIPLRFLVQWDDEVVPRDKCLELFGALGSERKTLHANPGAHAAVPEFEIRDSVTYLATQLDKLS